MSQLAGRFLGRDSIGYDGSKWGLYEYVRAKPLDVIDPMGSWQRPGPQIPGSVSLTFAGKSKRCIFYSDPFKPGVAAIDTLPLNGGVLVPFEDQNDIFQKITSNGCCEVMFAGHQGGSRNAGGVKGMIKCQPYDGFGQRLAKAFKLAGCNTDCSIVLAACGSTQSDASACRQELANDSGCNVFRSSVLIPFYDPADPTKGCLNACTLDLKKVGSKCGSPVFPDSKYSSWPFIVTTPGNSSLFGSPSID